MNNHLVLLGGMGPQASIQLHQLLLGTEEGNEVTTDAFPTILHVSLSVPDFIADQSAESKAVRIINDACSELPLSSAKSIGIACNTAHRLLDRLTLPRHNFVSMIEAVTNQLLSKNVQHVGILASPNTIGSGLYRDALQQVGIHSVEPAQSDIEILDRLIHEVISGTEPSDLRPQLSAIGGRLRQQGADSLLLGCTELPLIGIESTLPTVDSLSALAEAMLSRK